MLESYQPAMTFLFFRATPVGVYINSDQKKSQGPLRQKGKLREERNFLSLIMRSRKRCLFPVNSKMDQERGKLKYKSNHADSMPAEVLKA